jgi:hypothetical protein
VDVDGCHAYWGLNYGLLVGRDFKKMGTYAGRYLILVELHAFGRMNAWRAGADAIGQSLRS